MPCAGYRFILGAASFRLALQTRDPLDIQRGIEARRQVSGVSLALEGSESAILGQAHGDTLTDGGFRALFKVSVTYPRFLLQVLACGILGGVSFAQPAAAVFILESYGFGEGVTTLVNVAYIGAGVAAGVLFGMYCSDARRFGVILKALFLICTATLSACAVLAATGSVRGGDRKSLLMIIVLSAISGMAALGFIGIGIEAAALYPVGPGYACWAIEIIIQGVGGALNYTALNKDGFTILAMSTGFAALLMLVGYRSIFAQ